MLDLVIIGKKANVKNNNIYSFKHTVRVDDCRRTKAMNLLKSLLGHSRIMVTIENLRGLVECNEEVLRGAAPRLVL